MDPIVDSLRRVQDRIAAACAAAGRDRSEVTLVAVSKGFGADAVSRVRALGQIDFGENRLQEAEPKIEATRALGARWHFLGQIQTNKLNRILTAFATVQSLDRLEVIEKAERFLSAAGLERDALVEIRLGGGGHRGGMEPEDLKRLWESGVLSGPKRLRIRGLMGIAPHPAEPGEVRKAFDSLRKLFDEGRRAGTRWDVLSMGMSADLEAAIAAGSTMVRVGTAIFGGRYDKVTA